MSIYDAMPETPVSAESARLVARIRETERHLTELLRAKLAELGIEDVDRFEVRWVAER